MIYQPGQAVKLYADIYPAFINPLPPNVPGNSSYKFRILITERAVTIAWSTGSHGIQSVDLEFEPEEILNNVSYRGGLIGGYAIGERSGCPSCGARTIRGWKPFPGVTLVSTPIEPPPPPARPKSPTPPYSGRYSRD